jgi:creatinine amidohydrolase
VGDSNVLYTVPGPKLLGEMTSPEVEAVLKASGLALIAAGSIEAHGPHLPLLTDTLTGEALCRRVIARLGRDGRCAVGLAIPFGPVPDRMRWPGTITVSNATFIALARDVGRSLFHHGFKQQVWLVCHLDNYAPMLVVARDLVDELGIKATVLSGWIRVGDYDARYQLSTAEHPEGDGHGGEMETSRVLATHPALVAQSRLTNFVEPPRKEKIAYDEIVLNGGGIYSPPADFGTIAPLGFVGRADLGTAEKGEQSFGLAVEWIVKVINRDFPTTAGATGGSVPPETV